MISSDEGNSGGSPVKKKARGSRKLQPLVERHVEQREKVNVEFDADLNPIGEEKNRFISYIGYVSRSKVGISWPNWKAVPKDTKAMIWEQLLQTYDVSNTRQMYKLWMGQVRERWKDFKSKLTTQYIQGPKRNKDPCQDYSYLPPDDWRLFVASRQDPKCLELSEANKVRRAKSNYPHCMSHRGYRKLEKKTMRSVLKGEKYINSNVVEVAGRIDDLEGQSKQGSFTQSGKKDILATTLGKLDHPSFVRGEPSEIGFSRYCGRTSQQCGECERCREFVTKVKEKVRQSLLEELLPKIRGEIRLMMSSSMQVGTGQEEHKSQESSSFSSSKGSYNPPELGHGDLSPTPKVGDVSM